MLGRETAIQEAYWGDDDWLWVKNGPVPSTRRSRCPAPATTANYWAEQRYSFDEALHKDFQWLRTPEPERIFRRRAAAG